MPGPKRIVAVLAAAVPLAVVAGCGSGDVPKTIPPDAAQAMNADLVAVQQAVASTPPDCATAQLKAQAFVSTVNTLPKTVGTSVKAPLQAAGQQLVSLAGDPNQCQSPSGATGLTGQQPSGASTSSQTTSSATTTTTTTTSSTATHEQPPAPPGGDHHNGGGGQGGNDGGTGGGTGPGAGGG